MVPMPLIPCSRSRRGHAIPYIGCSEPQHLTLDGLKVAPQLTLAA